jgi:hypothetical protein
MSEGQEPRKPYVYTFRTSGRERDRDDSEATDRATYESLLSIKQSLLLLTGGCEIVPHEDGYRCEKHGRPVKSGESRCDYLADRFSAAVGETNSKTQIQHYVNDMLGIKDPRNVKRLTG